jgi:hypothetical protein
VVGICESLDSITTWDVNNYQLFTGDQAHADACLYSLYICNKNACLKLKLVFLLASTMSKPVPYPPKPDVC